MRTTGPGAVSAFNPAYAVELEPEETPEGQRWQVDGCCVGQFVGQDRLTGLRALSLEAEQRGCVTAQDGSEADGGEARSGGAVYPGR
jgi:hypothetical protein